MSQDHGHDADRKFLRNFAGVIIALALSGICFGILANVLAGDYNKPDEKALLLADQRASERLQPVGQVSTANDPAAATTVAAASESSSKTRSGQQVVEQVCAACHTTKFMNAPQVGNKEEWAPRAKQGLDTLVEQVLKGFGNMPPQSGSVNEEEARAAIKYMVEEKTGIQLK